MDSITEDGNRPTVPSLGNGIHVWCIRLDAPGDGWQGLLSGEEQQRAQRFHFERDRRRFGVARASLRRLLAAYTQEDATRLDFCYSSFGKPSLSVPATDISFNVSHSQDLALLAVTRSREIGVDVEYVRPEVEIESLAERFFSPQERTGIRSLSEDDRVAAFFHCWTCKEAYLKAQGTGLSLSLDSFDVSVHPNQPAALLATRPDARESQRWSLWSLEVAPGYAAAVVTEFCTEQPQLLHWRPSLGDENGRGW